MKAYTDLEQSKKLAKILPRENADMHYERVYFEGKQSDWFVKLGTPIKSDDIIPCWSLAALLDVLDYEIVNKVGISYFLNIYKEYNQYQLCYRYELDDIGEYDIWTDSYDEFVDACYEMILKLKENNLL